MDIITGMPDRTIRCYAPGYGPARSVAGIVSPSAPRLLNATQPYQDATRVVSMADRIATMQQQLVWFGFLNGRARAYHPGTIDNATTNAINTLLGPPAYRQQRWYRWIYASDGGASLDRTAITTALLQGGLQTLNRAGVFNYPSPDAMQARGSFDLNTLTGQPILALAILAIVDVCFRYAFNIEGPPAGPEFWIRAPDSPSPLLGLGLRSNPYVGDADAGTPSIAPLDTVKPLLDQAAAVYARIHANWHSGHGITQDLAADFERIARIGEQGMALLQDRDRAGIHDATAYIRRLRDVTQWLRDDPDVTYAAAVVGLLRDLVARRI